MISLRTLRSAIIGFAATTMLLVGTTLPLVSAQIIDDTSRPSVLPPESNFKDLAMLMINFFLSFLGFIAVVFVIYGGVMYVTSGGQQDKVDTAKKILLYAGIGLIIVLLSFAFVNTILAAPQGQVA